MFVLCEKVGQLCQYDGNALVKKLKSEIENSEDLKELFCNDDGSYKNEKEVDAWRNSLPCLFDVLHENGFDQIYAVIEYCVPYQEKRMDVVLLGTGVHGKTLATVVELKQWNDIYDDLNLTEENVRISNNEVRPHPCYQLQKYESLLNNSHTGVRDYDIEVDGVLFLHNFHDKSRIFSNQYEVYEENYEGRTFISGNALAEYLNTKYINDNQQLNFLKGEFVISTDVFEHIKEFLNGEFATTFLGEQEDILSECKEAIEEQEKRNSAQDRLVIVISGSAGTGKSVLGLYLLLWYYQRCGEQADGILYSTCNRTLSNILDSALKGDTHYGMTALFYSVVKELKRNNKVLKLLIVDEAQRLKDKDMKETVPELLPQSKILVLLQDDNQIIRYSEAGTRQNIRVMIKKGYTDKDTNEPFDNYHAFRNGVSVKLVDNLFLKSRLRNGDGSSFGNLVDDFLSEKNPGSYPRLREDFEIKVEDSLKDVERDLEAHIESSRCKWLAPYCWKWNSIGTKRKDIREMDIKIDDNGELFERLWNPYSPEEQAEWYRCDDEDSFNRVGCVYTCQGLEFDYVGLIVWDDLLWTGSGWKTDISKNWDKTFIEEIVGKLPDNFKNQDSDGISHIPEYRNNLEILLKGKDMDKIKTLVLNTYRILYTRAKKGIYIWFKDPGTKERFMEFLER